MMTNALTEQSHKKVRVLIGKELALARPALARGRKLIVAAGRVISFKPTIIVRHPRQMARQPSRVQVSLR
jgi:hypothetical protein